MPNRLIEIAVELLLVVFQIEIIVVAVQLAEIFVPAVIGDAVDDRFLRGKP